MSSAKSPTPGAAAESVSSGFLAELYHEITDSTLNLILLAVTLYLIVKIIRSWLEKPEEFVPPPPPPKQKKGDLTLSELRKFDGVHDPTGPILLAVNGRIFNVTRGKRFYGPGGPYEALAGHDASRAFAKFETDLVKEEYDDLSDLTPDEVQGAKDWEEQLAEKYDFVGKLIRPEEERTKYSDDEGEEDTSSSETVKKNE